MAYLVSYVIGAAMMAVLVEILSAQTRTEYHAEDLAATITLALAWPVLVVAYVVAFVYAKVSHARRV